MNWSLATKDPKPISSFLFGAEDGNRTRDPVLRFNLISIKMLLMRARLYLLAGGESLSVVRAEIIGHGLNLA
ncbi:MAG: hypothetical protein US86_C0007G0082 [Candidatus Daviesbacteria bacterium GW2011_GWA2_38_24]|uniref:Uncharacterized protein n=1 Tax=Candidatus Daviesbacteria bacterium GW2011_GWA2_38_24 TaxID=1618422 RepID=A0A0G0JH29_9BACT|nr:MAG: hypothetical protein US86_C0007G0082 [Candidatus Daviesbacteria bacterium GW2011_GWA2_38_24]KKQ80309.1 MAG: hypothetical protein UT01_C0015G0012 [Candidatus Daviesbacteria bacterium GW2011_GWA1_38_7]